MRLRTSGCRPSRKWQTTSGQCALAPSRKARSIASFANQPAWIRCSRAPPPRQRLLRQRLLQAAIHRYGMRLAVKAEAAEKQDPDTRVGDPEGLAPFTAPP